MQFCKLNIVLAVLVLSFNHIRSSSGQYHPVADADDGVDDTDQGVDDSDEGLNDADERVNDADQGVNDADEGVNDADQGVDDADEGVNDADQGVNDADEEINDADKSVSDTSLEAKTDEIGPIPDQCKPGQYFYTKGCNICYCYAEGTQGCTDIVCQKDTKITLLGKPKQTLAYKKLRDTATACVPGEKFTSNGCNCNCVIPSVMTCDKSCVYQ